MIPHRLKKFIKKFLYPDSNIYECSQEIESPTLLINAEFRSKAKLIGLIPIRCLPFFKDLLPVNSPVLMRLYFENLFNGEIPERRTVPIGIFYPGDKINRSSDIIIPSRSWHLQHIPSFNRKGEYCYSKFTRLFLPEVPGTHTFLIEGDTRLYKYADYHGVTDRKIKQINGHWYASFHVITVVEFLLYTVACMTLLSTIIVLIITVYNLPEKFLDWLF